MEQNIGNGIKSRYDLEKGKIHREHISIAQGCTKQVNTGRNTVAQERIAELIPGRDGVVRREGLLIGNTCNDSQVHLQIPISTLPHMKTVVLRQDGVGG
jgi:hypothetical protein